MLLSSDSELFLACIVPAKATEESLRTYGE